MLCSNPSASAGVDAPPRGAGIALDREIPGYDSLLSAFHRAFRSELEAPRLEQLHDLVDPRSPHHLLAQPHLTMTWLSELATARKR